MSPSSNITHPYVVEDVVGLEGDSIASCDRVGVGGSSTAAKASEVGITHV